MSTQTHLTLTFSRYTGFPVMCVRYWNSKWREPNSARIEEPPDAQPQFLIAPLQKRSTGIVCSQHITRNTRKHTVLCTLSVFSTLNCTFPTHK